MSITSDIRSYADTALGQGKQVLDQAQAQLNDVTGQANEFVSKLSDKITESANVSGLTSKATGAVNDLRAQAEKAINLDAIKSAIEPYLAQAKGYTTTVTDRAESLLSTVKNDKRVSNLVDSVESFTGTVVETVQDKVIKPVQSLTGRGAKPATKPTAATKPVVATKPAPVKAAAKPATKPAPAKPAIKATAKATARKSSVRRSAKA
ncbi:MAG: hypothetical protein ABI232_07330 [Jatrophihabitantaceae bacterium]